jgi:hypothetical protein
MALRGTMIVLGVLFVLGTDGIAASAPAAGPDPGNFVGRVDNTWFPLAPGTAAGRPAVTARRPAST